MMAHTMGTPSTAARRCPGKTVHWRLSRACLLQDHLTDDATAVCFDHHAQAIAHGMICILGLTRRHMARAKCNLLRLCEIFVRHSVELELAHVLDWHIFQRP